MRPRSDSPTVSSSENEVARRIRRLAHRREPGEVLLEGPRVVREAALAGVELELLVLRDDVRRFDAAAERTVVLSERLFNSVSTTVTPQGVMAIARRDTVPLAAARSLARAAGWPLVVLDGVQDPGNVGTIVRTAAAAGAPAVVALEGTADPLGPKAVRASAGNVFRVAVSEARWEELEGLDVWGAAAEGGEPLYESAPERADAILLGSEAHGLRHAPRHRVSIPVAEGVESLNVAAAAAVVLFEIRRRVSR
jgi:RNA methyltransferase, TrmH family